MPIEEGRIKKHKIQVLRDTGCNGVIVKKKFVEEGQYTGKMGSIRMVDRTVRRAPFAKIRIDTPYYTGEVIALCLEDVMYDLILGNIPEARAPDNPDNSWAPTLNMICTSTDTEMDFIAIKREDFIKL